MYSYIACEFLLIRDLSLQVRIATCPIVQVSYMHGYLDCYDFHIYLLVSCANPFYYAIGLYAYLLNLPILLFAPTYLPSPLGNFVFWLYT